MQYRWKKFHFELSLWSRFCHLYYERFDGDKLIGIAFPPIALWIGYDGKFQSLERKTIGIHIHDWNICWYGWIDNYDDIRHLSWYRHFVINPLDLIFGKPKYTEEII